jgi:hypothetical protein
MSATTSRHRTYARSRSSFQNRILRRLCLLWPIAFTMVSLGCQGAEFNHDFASLNQQKSDRADPIVGDWQGSWRFSDKMSTYRARAVVIARSSSKYTIELELSHFEPVPGTVLFPWEYYWISLDDISIAVTPDATAQFIVKTSSVRGSRRFPASPSMTFTGKECRDLFVIEFITDSSSCGTNCGRITLSRPAKVTTDPNAYSARLAK